MKYYKKFLQKRTALVAVLLELHEYTPLATQSSLQGGAYLSKH